MPDQKPPIPGVLPYSGYPVWEDGYCAYCGETAPVGDTEPWYRFECPTCYREGCPECMPAGRHCECPECEERE